MQAAKPADSKKLVKPKGKPSAGEFARDAALDVDIEKFNQSVHAVVVKGSRLYWLKELEKAVPA